MLNRDLSNVSASDTFAIDGTEIISSTPDEVTQYFIDHASKSASTIAVHFINAYNLALASKSAQYKELLKSPSLNLPDGKPLTWFRKPARQVRGPQVFESVLDLGRQEGLTHFFLGSSPDTLEKLLSEVLRRFPGVGIAGSYSPPFRELSNDELNEINHMIELSHADIVWVGLGTPKQDFEVNRLARQRVAPLIAAVGAAFDFTARTKPKAPRYVSWLGLEWLFRLCCEPRRLWKRYFFGNLIFLKLCARDWWSTR